MALILSTFPNKQSLIALTNELYRLTLLFPKKEPLRYKMREAAVDILANFLRIEKNENISRQILESLEILESFFEIVKNQNWVKKEEILNLQNDYSKMKSLLQQKLTEAHPPLMEKVQESTSLFQPGLEMKERQEKILEFLREKGRAQVGDIKKIFPEITKRTLRRDFRDLLKKGTIERLGERNETFYKIKQ